MKLSRFQPVTKHLEEPPIEVGEEIGLPEPKMGLTLLGPLGKNSENYQINIGMIGDLESLENAKNFFERFNVTTKGKEENFLHTDFPGLGKLKIKFNIQSTAEIVEAELQKLDKASSFSERVETSLEIIKEKIRALVERDPAPHILVLAYPKKIDHYCIESAVGQRAVPITTKLEKIIRRRKKEHKTLDHFFGTPVPDEKFSLVDLRSNVKATCMSYNIPIQIIRPQTTEVYDPEKSKKEDDATIFWNLVVAMFYKANHIPWRVKGLMDDTCYIGISFFRSRDDENNVKTSLAQVFSLNTEGFVLKGGRAVVSENKSLHVSKKDANQLIQRAISLYKRNNDNKLPSRIVIHKTSRYDREEIDGFRESAKEIHKLDLLTLGSRNIKLMRRGNHPPVRGTFVKLPDDSILLYTSGYIPYLDVYPGPRVPSPLEILEHHGKTPIDLICKEILALTKLNWNNAKFYTKAPITIGFAKKVGQILRELPPDFKMNESAEKFRFYM